MKRVLPETLHARPANLLVRVAKSHQARVELVTGAGRADAKSIVAVLALGAREGDEVELLADGPDAEVALAALGALIDAAFDRDLVPETGTAEVAGIAIGVAVVARRTDDADAPLDTRRDALAAAFAQVGEDLAVLVAALSPDEAALFEPERAIVLDLERYVLARLDEGAGARDAILEATSTGGSDLLLDARARVLAALSGGDAGALGERVERVAGAGGAAIVVAEALTPSMVASFPAAVVGVAAVDPEQAATSHAAILARGRGLPLLWIPPHVAASIGDGDLLVLDTSRSPARLWIDPAPELVADARARLVRLEATRVLDAARAEAPLTALGLAVRVNVGSVDDAIPAGAEGVGLLRTELLFADRTRAPTEAEQRAALETIAGHVGSRPLVVRLFDAGGDKPLGWLSPRSAAPDARGVALLFAHASILDAQLGAIRAVAREGRDVRVLLPFAHHPDELALVRRKLGRAIPVGAMIETVAAVGAVDVLAAAGDFVCVGTNDLAASTLGGPRGSAESALDRRVLLHLERIVAAGRAHRRQVTVCGEIAAIPAGARVLVGLGVDALSVAPVAWAPLKLALSGVSAAECREAARAALR